MEMYSGKCIKLLLIWIVLMTLVRDNDAWWSQRRRRRRQPPPRSPPPATPDRTKPTFTYCPSSIGPFYTTSDKTYHMTWETPRATDNSGHVEVTQTSEPVMVIPFNPSVFLMEYRATDRAGNYATCPITYQVYVIRCKSLTLYHGSVSCSNTHLVSSVCTHSCTTGYYLVGSRTRRCYRSGNNAYWTGSKSHCARVLCDALPLTAPRYGGTNCSDGSYYNSRCTFFCKEGYTLQSSPSSRICLHNGAWSGSDSTPSCADTSPPTFTRCPAAKIVIAPPLQTSATVTWSIPLVSDTSGQTITAHQEDGFDSGSIFEEGNHIITYRATDSAGNSATCSFSVTVKVVRCPSLRPFPPLQVSCPQGNIHDAECTYSCSLGFTLHGQETRRCLASGITGYWSSDKETGSGDTETGTSWPYSWSNGTGTGTSGIEIDEPGSWSSSLWESELAKRGRQNSDTGTRNVETPSCQTVTCPTFQEEQNMLVLGCDNQNPLPYGTRCRVLCRPAFGFMDGGGMFSTQCQEDGTWSENITCISRTCPPLEPPPYGYFIRGPSCSHSVRVGTVCILGCLPGFRPKGVIVNRCMTDGNWMRGIEAGMECLARHCEPLTLPLHGIAISECERTYGSMCQISCSEGYRLVGSSNGSCEFNGTTMIWQFEEEPVCENLPHLTKLALALTASASKIIGTLSTLTVWILSW